MNAIRTVLVALGVPTRVDSLPFDIEKYEAISLSAKA
jgi:hypothetical protein